MISQVRSLFFLSIFLAASFSLMVLSSVVYAGGTVKIDDTRWVNIGMGIKTSFNFIEDGSLDRTHYGKDFLVENFRFYFNGQLHEKIKFTFNADRDTPASGNETIRILDSIVKFEFSDPVNFWIGRFHLPSDRSNLSGPFFINSWDSPFVSRYTNVYAGRDSGAVVWGQFGGGKFKYQVGAFEGIGETAVSATVAGPNQSDNLLYAGRVVLNFWDPEPGYYNRSTYYGQKNILAVGLAGMTQSDAVGGIGPGSESGDLTAWNVDFLLERNLGEMGVPTFEAAYYDYDGEGRDVRTLAGDSREGTGYFLLGSYLLPGKMGPGAVQGGLQPLVRYQSFKNEGAVTGKHNRLDFALSYIIDGHNARITALFGLDDPAASDRVKLFKLGFQIQI